jgi:hypothetical protein
MKRLNRHKDEKKPIRVATQDTILSTAPFSKAKLSGSKLSRTHLPGANTRKASIFDASLSVVRQSGKDLSCTNVFEIKKTSNKNRRKKLLNEAKHDSVYLANCCRCLVLFECDNKTQCYKDEAMGEFTTLCRDCKTELAKHGALRDEVEAILREMDQCN